MYFNKQCHDLSQSEVDNKISLNCIYPTETKETPTENKSSKKTNVISSIETNTQNRDALIKQHDTTDIQTYMGTKSCTSLTDSGLNISDNDEIQPSPTSINVNWFPSSATSSTSEQTATSVNTYKKQFHKNTNQDNNISNNNNKYNNFNNHNFNAHKHNYGYDADYDDENDSTNFNNKLKSEQDRIRQQQQQILKVENTSYQCKQTANKNENVINISDQQNLTTQISAVTSNDRLSLQHNEYTMNRSPRSALASTSPSTSLSMTSITNSYNHNPPSKIRHITCYESPVVSIRSINSTIVTSDSDSNSDLSDDTEGVHENYVIKRLGTQVTYPPTHPDIPNINSNGTILNQKVIPNADQVALSSLATLAAIGDSIGAAQALGPVPSYSAVPQRPQIGSIALSNSNDVTFGDKHFYEGPVTIQQFLIDGRDKWKETNERENPTFMNDNVEASNNAKDINSSGEESSKVYGYILRRKKLIIPGTLAVMALLIVIVILGSNALNDSKSKLLLGNSEESRKNIPINSTIAQDNVGGGYVLRIVPRIGWLAQPPLNPWVPLDHPVERIIVIPTRTSECETQASCTYTVRITQTFNIESQQQDDIIYNFLVGGDGNVYEGRGWDNRCSVLKGFNDDSITFAYIGSFKKQPPSYKQLNVTRLLLQEGVRLKKLSPNYRIVAANKLDPTAVATLADALYKSFENWPHWSEK